jgi:hypothetical protein
VPELIAAIDMSIEGYNERPNRSLGQDPQPHPRQGQRKPGAIADRNVAHTPLRRPQRAVKCTGRRCRAVVAGVLRAMIQQSSRAIHPGRASTAALVVAAVAVGVGGYFHGRLWHQGYSDVHVVGPLFFLNVIGSAAVILVLTSGRVLLFIGGALSISLGAIVSILIAHQASFFRFSEQGYSSSAKTIMIAEATAVIATLLGAAFAGRRLLTAAAPAL